MRAVAWRTPQWNDALVAYKQAGQAELFRTVWCDHDVVVKRYFKNYNDFDSVMRLVSSADQRNLATVLDWFKHAGNRYEVQRYIPGLLLSEHASTTPFCRRDDGVHLFFELALALAQGLAALHDVGLVHRDIKPSNIIVPHGLFRDATIIDFGTAVVVRSHTAASQRVGVVGFIAPECYDGGLSGGSDYYALGATLFSAFSGRSILVSETEERLPDEYLRDEAIAGTMRARLLDRTFRSQVPAAIYQTLYGLLDPSPFERWGCRQIGLAGGVVLPR